MSKRPKTGHSEGLLSARVETIDKYTFRLVAGYCHDVKPQQRS
jgi:hypothetical protein